MHIIIRSESDLDLISRAMENKEPEIMVEFTAFFILETRKTQTIVNHINIMWEDNPQYELAEYGEKEDGSGTIGYIFRLKG